MAEKTEYFFALVPKGGQQPGISACGWLPGVKLIGKFPNEIERAKTLKELWPLPLKEEAGADVWEGVYIQEGFYLANQRGVREFIEGARHEDNKPTAQYFFAVLMDGYQSLPEGFLGEQLHGPFSIEVERADKIDSYLLLVSTSAVAGMIIGFYILEGFFVAWQDIPDFIKREKREYQSKNSQGHHLGQG